MSVTHSGTTATISAASPLATACSDQATIMLPPVSSSSPMAATRSHSPRLSATRRPCSLHTTSISGPAITKRTPKASAAGMCSTAMRMPR